eukprot:2056392-Pleurochrysis_carterae.AAC.4
MLMKIKPSPCRFQPFKNVHNNLRWDLAGRMSWDMYLQTVCSSRSNEFRTSIRRGWRVLYPGQTTASRWLARRPSL